MVPRSAVVRYAGSEWVYRELQGDRFVRVEILPAESISRATSSPKTSPTECASSSLEQRLCCQKS